MQKVETSWRKDGNWKARYSKLYSCRQNSMSEEVEPERISFMSNLLSPYTSMSLQQKAQTNSSATDQNLSSTSESLSPQLQTLLSQQSDIYNSCISVSQYDSLGGNDTMLLNMVRARSRELEEAQDQPLDLPCTRDNDNDSEGSTFDACVHGLSMRTTERSASRSRISRISTKRDMDIPSILAFNISTPTPEEVGLPAFRKASSVKEEEIPRWSIRRSICPVCSEKWKDKSFIRNIKSSGLKRTSSSELPSIIAPARLRNLTVSYFPRPALAATDKDSGMSPGRLSTTSASWQLTRARRFRTPKPQLPSAEATAPPKAAAPLAQKDLNLRINRFLTDTQLVYTTPESLVPNPLTTAILITQGRVVKQSINQVGVGAAMKATV